MRVELEEAVAALNAETATGCPGAGGYRAFAKSQGFQYIRTLNTSSSAGDWEFLVSKDRETWYVMTQRNNWPRPGFSYDIDTDTAFLGTFGEAAEQVFAFY